MPQNRVGSARSLLLTVVCEKSLQQAHNVHRKIPTHIHVIGCVATTTYSSTNHTIVRKSQITRCNPFGLLALQCHVSALQIIAVWCVYMYGATFPRKRIERLLDCKRLRVTIVLVGGIAPHTLTLRYETQQRQSIYRSTATPSCTCPAAPTMIDWLE